MSYAMSAPLQAAVYQHIAADGAVQALVGSDVFDAAPAGTLPSLYVLMGGEKVREAGQDDAAWHDFNVSVITDGPGFHAAKEVAGAVSDALVDAPLTLSRGRLVGLWFRKADAKRVSGGLRRIDMTFRARVEDDAA